MLSIIADWQPSQETAGGGVSCPAWKWPGVVLTARPASGQGWCWHPSLEALRGERARGIGSPAEAAGEVVHASVGLGFPAWS